MGAKKWNTGRKSIVQLHQDFILPCSHRNMNDLEKDICSETVPFFHFCQQFVRVKERAVCMCVCEHVCAWVLEHVFNVCLCVCACVFIFMFFIYVYMSLNVCKHAFEWLFVNSSPENWPPWQHAFELMCLYVRIDVCIWLCVYLCLDACVDVCVAMCVWLGVYACAGEYEFL